MELIFEDLAQNLIGLAIDEAADYDKAGELSAPCCSYTQSAAYSPSYSHSNRT
jgi:hypothetical protein